MPKDFASFVNTALSPYEGMKLEDIVKEARKERQERDKKMTEIEDELLRLVRNLGMD